MSREAGCPAPSRWVTILLPDLPRPGEAAGVQVNGHLMGSPPAFADEWRGLAHHG
jgi:hypothetical protein